MDESGWKKPSDVMKTMRRRKSVSQKRITADSDKRTSVIYKSPSKSVKRKNPFHKDSPHPFPAKRQNIGIDVQPLKDKDPLSCQLFTLLETANTEEEAASESQKAAQVLKQQQYNKLRSLNSEQQASSTAIEKKSVPAPEPPSENVLSSYLPVDWCLKAKLRVVSSRPLNWCTQIRSTDESYGVKQFVQATTETSTESWEKRLFQSSCMYWAHPNIPWMKLFPRIVDDVKSSMVASYLLQEDVQKALQADWEHSFTSAYHHLRSGLCPYFYLCTHQFTVLFYNQSKTPSGIVCLVTPTTRGFRELLENEGIEFKLPVGKKSTSPDKKENVSDADITTSSVDTTEVSQEKTDDNDDDGDDILDNDDAASGWLESMGLDKKQFPTLDPKKVKMQREGFRVIDHRPESLVYIDSANVQAFFNFLLNCRTCVAMSGTQAGLPPTVLSPTPFKGATLKTHKVKHTVVKQGDKDSNITQAHILEIAGPIMPSHCQQLVSLLHHTQKADFGMTFNNHDPTVPFNILSKLIEKKSTVSVLDKSDNSTSPKSNNASPITDRKNSSTSERRSLTLLETIDEAADDIKENSAKISDIDVNGKTVTKLNIFHRPVPTDKDRVCGIKELVCTNQGFTWTT